ncbi:MAG: outer membrane protein assembly factor BamE [Kiritimatiellia bacterium]|jgi:outer membrane protein assembly factor BamE
MIKKLLLLLSVSSILFLSGCSNWLPKAYRIDIPQGNLVTQEKVNAVKTGMNRRQVQHILGSPLLVDTFNQNRWDYFYSVDTKKGTNIEYHITITFRNDVVAEINENQ